jgi:threonine synthase
MRDGRLFLQYEGLNPSGSFKDNGMAGAFTHARLVGARIAACASTGNTSASLAAFASALGNIRAVIFVGSGKIALGKLSQALDFGGATFQIPGDFDDAMARVREVCRARGLYLMNSVNPFRLEGQKAIIYRVLEGLGWEVPDWIVVPGGNLGNSSAFGKALRELHELGLIPRLPRLAIIVARGANTLYRLFEQRGVAWHAGTVYDEPIDFYYRTLSTEGWRAKTVASAIEINRPVNLKKALRALEITRGLVREASDEEILDAKAIVGRDGIGCEPASAASVAGVKQLVAEGVIGADERVVCILTGHQLKAPEATIGYHSAPGDALRAKLEQEYHVRRTNFSNRPVPVGNDLQEILRALEGVLKEPVGAVEVKNP